MANEEWIELYKEVVRVIDNEGVSNHSPAIIRMGNDVSTGKNPFNFFRMWTLSSCFKEVVSRAWKEEVVGSPMYKLVSKLKKVKLELKNINKIEFSNLPAQYNDSFQKLIQAFEAFHNDSGNAELCVTKIAAAEKYKMLSKSYTQFLQQKAKQKWIKDGDANTSLFHQFLKKRRLRGNVYVIQDTNGVVKDSSNGVNQAFLGFFQDLLCNSKQDRMKVEDGIV